MNKYQEALDGIIEGNVKFSETVDLMFFIKTSIEHNNYIGDNLKKQCLDYLSALENAEIILQELADKELVDKETPMKPKSFNDLRECCLCSCGYDFYD